LDEKPRQTALLCREPVRICARRLMIVVTSRSYPSGSPIIRHTRSLATLRKVRDDSPPESRIRFGASNHDTPCKAWRDSPACPGHLPTAE